MITLTNYENVDRLSHIVLEWNYDDVNGISTSTTYHVFRFDLSYGVSILA